ncbi:MAG: inositol monophosphatase [Candidatus Tectomicrobia bacterium]|nr:inositol monophosphatase [Candidatus Tectomicrobia bacterium]
MGLPNDALLEQIETMAVRFARGAGRIVLGYFGADVEVNYKSKGKADPVTNADRESEAYLTAEIGAAFPDHAIVGEEGARVSAGKPEFTWVLDPLDGTANFMNRLPVFAVSIGVLYRGQPAAGAIFVPSAKSSQGTIYHARRGNGAYRDGHRIQVQREAEIGRTKLVSLPGNHYRIFTLNGHLRKHSGEVRMSGSIAYEMALTASGSFSYCVIWTPKIWDVAAGVLLVQEAGGAVYARRPRSHRWTPLEHFGPTAAALPADLTQLSNWRASLIVGQPGVARLIAENLRRLPRRKPGGQA